MPFSVVLSRVRRMLRDEMPMEHIEAMIESSGLVEDERALLWLYAWFGGEAAEMAEIVGRCS